jgi:hypothetical protein
VSDPIVDLKDELLAAADRRHLRRHPRRKRVLLASATASIAAAVALLVTAPWNDSPGFLERAQAALTPDPETVLHQRWEVTSISTDPACTVAHGPNEIWIDQTPPHTYRAVLHFPREPRDLPAFRCRSGPAFELGGTFDTEAISVWGGTNLSALDPVTELREAISAGTARDEGRARLDGRTVQRIRIDPRPSACPDPSCPHEPAYAYVDPETFLPVEMHGFGIIGPPSGPVESVRLVTRVVTFEYLPRTPANLALTYIRAEARPLQ